MKVGNKLRSLRVEKGYTPLDIAEHLQISESTYRRYERDETSPDIYTLDKIAKIYNKSVTDILPEEMIVINTNQQGGTSTNAVVVNQYLSEKLVEQYEQRIKDLTEQLEYWKNKS